MELVWKREELFSTFPPPSSAYLPQVILHQLTLPLQAVDVSLTAGELQADHRAAVGHTPVNFLRGCFSHNLHDRQQLLLESALSHFELFLTSP